MLLVPNLYTKDIQLGQAWKNLQRFMQTEVEHKRVTNATVGAFVRGQVVYLTAGNRQALLSIATSAAAASWVGVTVEPIAASARGIISYAGYRLVRFDNGLTLNEGEPAYVSAATAGNCTNVEPLNPNYSSTVGIIGDATGYVTITNPYAWIFVGKCCTPYAVQPG